MRIAMFGQKRIPSREGGVEVVVEELSTRMGNKGHEVAVINRRGHHSADDEYDSSLFDEYKGVKIKTVQTINRKGLAAVSSSVSASIKTALGPYDVIHIHAEGLGFVSWLSKLPRKKVIVTIHGLKDIIWLNQKTSHEYSVLMA